MRALLLLLLILMTQVVLAGERRNIDDFIIAAQRNDGHEALRAARDMLRQQRRESASALVRVEVEPGICVECENLINLTDDVEKVLTKLGQAPREVEDLAVVKTYLRYIDETTGQRDCLVARNQELSEEFREVDLESALLLYEGDFDLDRLESWRISGGELPGTSRPGDTVFLRGKGDDHDLFIRVDLASIPGNPPRVSVYKLMDVRVDLAETPSEVRDRDNPLPDLGFDESSWRPSWTRRGEIDSSLQLGTGEETSVRVGPILHMRDYIPQQITIFDFKTRQQLNEENDLEVTGEISTRRREARFALVGRHGAGEKAWLEVRDDGDFEVGVPYSVLVQGSPLNGGFVANESGAGMTVHYDDSSGGRTKARYFNEHGDNRYELDHRRKLTKNSSMTFRLSRDKDDKGVWLLYRYDFD